MIQPSPAWRSLERKIIACEHCPRLREYCHKVGQEKRRAYADWDYWAQPVPNFGSAPAPLLIVGLAPAAHGANRTGRMFTGDRSGEWLYRALYKAGFASQAKSESRKDGLRLTDCAITAICHCAPPDNEPTREEIANCRPWLTATIDQVQPRVLLALGHLAWKAVVAEIRERDWLMGHTSAARQRGTIVRTPKFSHGAKVPLENDRWLLGSYHPSQQNTFTGRLTEAMLDAVFTEARRLLM